MSSVDNDAVIYASVQTVQLSAQNSLAFVKTKVELDSLVDTCAVGDHCLAIHDQNSPVNFFGCDPKAGSKHAHIVDANVLYRT